MTHAPAGPGQKGKRLFAGQEAGRRTGPKASEVALSRSTHSSRRGLPPANRRR